MTFLNFLISPFFKFFFKNVFIIFVSYISKCLKIYQRNIINKIKKDNRRKLVKDIKIFLKKKKKEKQQYCCECYKNISENEKQKLVKYRKKYYRMRKNALL